MMSAHQHFTSLAGMVESATANPDLDAACRTLQEFLGVETGDVASIAFYNIEPEEWKTLSLEARREALIRYLKMEMDFLPSLLDITPEY